MEIIINVAKDTIDLEDHEIRILQDENAVEDFASVNAIITDRHITISHLNLRLGNEQILTPDDTLVISTPELATEYTNILRKGEPLKLTRELCTECHVHYYHRTSHRATNLHVTMHDLNLQKNVQPSNSDPVYLLLEGGESPTPALTIVDDQPVISNFKVSFLATADIHIKRVWFQNTAGYIHFHSDNPSMVTEVGPKKVLHINETVQACNTATVNLLITVENRIGGTFQQLQIEYMLNDIPYTATRIICVKKLFGNFCFKTNVRPIDDDAYTLPSRNNDKKPFNDPKYMNPLKGISEADIRIYNRMNDLASKSKVKSRCEAGQRLRLLKSVTDESNYKETHNLINSLELLYYVDSLKTIDSTFKHRGNHLTIFAPLQDLGQANLRVKDACILKIDETYHHAIVTLRDCQLCVVQLTEPQQTHFNSNRVAVTPVIRLKPYQIQFDAAAKWKAAKNIIFPTTTNTPKRQPPKLPTDITLDPSQSLGHDKAIWTSNDIPFILYGCAGSGKSNILLQILITLLRHGRKVMFCSPTNSNLNIFHLRFVNLLIKLGLTNIKVTKICALTSDVSPACREYCSIDKDGYHTLPTGDEVLDSDIVFVTFQNSTRCVGIRLADRVVSLEVDAIVSDEVSFCDELTALTPIISQMHVTKRSPKIILAGDPCQLYSQKRSNAAQVATQEDVISRLLRREVYQTNPNCSHYLNTNYRMPKLNVEIANMGAYSELPITSKVTEQGSLHVMHVDAEYSECRTNSTSLYSFPEAAAALTVAIDVENATKESTMILVTYSSMFYILTKLRKLSKNTKVQIATAEQVQGNSARNVIIVPCVQPTPTAWQRCVRRITMMFSRSQCRTYLVGDVNNLLHVPLYRKIIQTASRTGNVEAPTKVLNTLATYLN